jgi:hypothetical protein
MGRRGVIVVGTLVVGFLGGCGGSSHKAATSNATATSTTASAPAAPPAGILGRVFTNNELKGFTGSPGGMYTSARSLLGGYQDPYLNTDYARLTRLGFIRGVRENLSQGATSGLSEVEQFRSAKAASAERAAEIAEDKSGRGGPYKAFIVPGIPGARGFTLIQGGQGGVNIAFVKGSYYYLVGQELAPSESINAAIASLTAAAQHLYRRVSAT